MDIMADMFFDLESGWEPSNNEGHTAFPFHPFAEYEGIQQISPAQHHQLLEDQHCSYMDPVQENITPMKQVSQSSLYKTEQGTGTVIEDVCPADYYSTQLDQQDTPISPCTPQKPSLLPGTPLVHFPSSLFQNDILLPEHQETPLYPSPLSMDTNTIIKENGSMATPHHQTQASVLLPEPPITPSVLFPAENIIAYQESAAKCTEPQDRPSLHSSLAEAHPERVQFSGDPVQVERAEQFLSALLSHPTFPMDTYGIPSPYDVDLQPESECPVFPQDYCERGNSMSVGEGEMSALIPIAAQSGPPRILPKINNAGVTKRMSKRAAAKVAMHERRVRDCKLRQLAKTNVITDNELLRLKPKKKRRAAKFDKPKPSGFCHICSRTPKNVRVIPCANIEQGTCRKVICVKCFERFNLGNFQAVVSDAGTNWSCTHCSKTCPERAQCSTYQRTNDKLRLKRIKHDKPKGIGKRKKRNQHATISKPKPPACASPSTL